MSAYVYRCYADDRLIYVGATRNLNSRLKTHRSVSWWAHMVTSVKASVFPTVPVALAAERAAIGAENPRFNIGGRWAHRAKWSANDYRDYILAIERHGNPTTTYNVAHLLRVRTELAQRFEVAA